MLFSCNWKNQQNTKLSNEEQEVYGFLHLPNELLLIGIIIAILLMIISIIVSPIIAIISTNKNYKKQIDKNTNKKELEREKN